MYTPYPIVVYILGNAFVTINVFIHTDAAAHGPDIDRKLLGNISELIIHGRPLAPNDHVDCLFINYYVVWGVALWYLHQKS